MAKSSSDLIFDKNQCKEFIKQVENGIADFIGSDYEAARLIGFVSQMRELGHVSDDAAQQLLSDAYHLAHLARSGHRFAKMVRNPTAEMRIMVLADEERERRLA